MIVESWAELLELLHFYLDHPVHLDELQLQNRLWWNWRQANPSIMLRDCACRVFLASHAPQTPQHSAWLWLVPQCFVTLRSPGCFVVLWLLQCDEFAAPPAKLV